MRKARTRGASGPEGEGREGEGHQEAQKEGPRGSTIRAWPSVFTPFWRWAWENGGVRLGVISDIHAKLPALEAVLEALREEGVDEVLVLGDLVGYGPQPKQVIHNIWKEGLPAISGAWDLTVAYPLSDRLPEGVG